MWLVSASDARPASRGAGAAGDKGQADAGGLSAFLGRVLDQLSLSSWLPAAMLVGNLALLIKLRGQERVDVAAAVEELGRNPLGLAVILTFSLVLASIVTQAFEFEVIRLLEGYLDTEARAVRVWVGWRIKRHVEKRESLLAIRVKREQASFMLAREVMLNLPKPIPRKLLNVLEDDIFGRPNQGKLDEERRQLALGLPWQEYLSAHDAYRLEVLDARVGSYPKLHRVLPTRLGNVLRASEDLLPLEPEENLEGFAIRHLDRMSETLRSEHRDYRVRLDMYCTLTVVFILLAIFSLALVPRAPIWAPAVAAATYAILAQVSYEASIASARRYGNALIEIGGQVNMERRSRGKREGG